MKARFGAALLLCVTVALACAPHAAAQGKPVAPGNATSSQFMPAATCWCHKEVAAPWSSSMHAKAMVDPAFLTMAAMAKAQAGDSVANFCKRCHSPIGNMTSDYDATGSTVAKEGVTCMFCHQVTGPDGTKPGNTALLVQADLTRRAQIKDPAAPHKAVYSAFHRKAEFCGGCHNVSHPINGTHLETTYDEWDKSYYAENGVTCQDCHMTTERGLLGPSTGVACSSGVQRSDIYMMSFVGANVGQGPSDASVEMLKDAATVAIQAPEIVPAGSQASVVVTVTNTGAGHSLPTGLTETREMWLWVYAENPNGTTTHLGGRRFGTVLKDAKGNHPVEMWDATGIYSDYRIPAKGAVSAKFTFAMPAGAKRAKIVAVLNYRSLPDKLAAKAGVKNPTTVMAASDRTVFASQAEMDAAAKSGASLTAWVLPAIGVVLVVLVALGVVAMVRRPKRT